MADIISNLVAHWKLDETSGTVAADSSGNGHAGTYVNTPTLNQTGAFVTSKAVLFTRASTEYVLLGSKSATTPITVALWLKRTDTAAVHRLVHWGRTLLQVSAAGTGVTWYPDTSGGSTTFTVSALGTGWNHLVVTQTGTNATLYINGGSIATNATVAISTAAVTSYLAILAGSTDALNGTLDDVRIYSRALSAGDVAELFRYGADITSGLVAHWKLDETSGTSAADSSGNGHTVAMARDFTVTTTRGKILRALQCDGTNDTGTNNATAITNGASVLTLAAWAKTSATNKTICMVSTNADVFAARVRLSIGTAVANKYSLAVLIDGETVQEVYTSGSFADGAWHHIVGVLDLASDTIAIYVDGTSQTVIGTPAFTGTAWPASNPARLRLSGVGGSGRWNGTLDDVRIYSRALSAADVAALYAYNAVRFTTLNLLLPARYKKG